MLVLKGHPVVFTVSALLAHVAAAPNIQHRSANITIFASSSAFQAGSPTVIHVILKNISSQPFSIAWWHHVGRAELNYSVQVTDSAGVSPATTDSYSNSRQGPKIGSSIRPTLQPGGSLSEDFDLNRLYFLNHPGKYYVVVSRRDPSDASLTIWSNTLEIEVTPPAQTPKQS